MALRAIWATPLLYALEPLPLAAEPPASCPAPSLSATELYEVLNCSEEEPALEKAFAQLGFFNWFGFGEAFDSFGGT